MDSNYWSTFSTKRRLTRRRLLASAAGLAGAGFAMSLLGCGGDSGGGFKFEDAATSRQPGTVWQSGNDWKLGDETKEAVKGGIYRSVLNADQAGNFDGLTIAPSQTPYRNHSYETMVAKNRGPGIDPRSPEAGVPVPALAESWELSNDGSLVTFRLRPGVKFHNIPPVNGRVMDIDDWRTTHERFIQVGNQREAMTSIVDKAEFPDSKTMVWKLKHPYAPLLGRVWSDRFTYYINPKELNADQNLVASTAIGTGYKVLDVHAPSRTQEYKKHTEYWGGEPFIDRWHTPIIPEYSNRYAQFLQGNITDFAPTERDILALAKDAPRTVIVADELPDDHYEFIRYANPQFAKVAWDDPRVRIAVQRSINFKGIGEFLANKEHLTAAGITVEVAPRTHVPRDLSYWLDPEKGELGKLSENYLYNVAEAKKLATAAGFTSPIEITYTTLPTEGKITEAEQLVIDSLQQSGVFNVNVKYSLNNPDHRECRSLGLCNGIVRQGVSEEVDYQIYRWYMEEGNLTGEIKYPKSDPKLRTLAEAQRREMDPQARIGLLKEFQLANAEIMYNNSYIHQYSEFRFRWPWLHNAYYGEPRGVSLPPGRPVNGGHLHWLDSAMPNRNTRI